MTNAQKAAVDPAVAKKEALKANRKKVEGSLVIVVIGLTGLFLQMFLGNADYMHNGFVFIVNMAAVFASLFGLGIGLVQAVTGILIHFELIAELNSESK